MDHRRRYTPTSLISDLFIGVHYEDKESSLQWDAGMDYERKWVEARVFFICVSFSNTLVEAAGAWRPWIFADDTPLPV